MRPGRPRFCARALAPRRHSEQPRRLAHDHGAPQRHRPAAAREAIPGKDRGAGGAHGEDREHAAGRASRAHLHVLPPRPRARADARFDGSGRMILLQDQDRAKWDRRRIDETFSVVGRFLTMRRPGPYQLQALIAGAHADAKSWDATRWPDILRSYDALLAINDSPIVRLNRAIAVWHVHGAEQAYVELFPLAEDLRSEERRVGKE